MNRDAKLAVIDAPRPDGSLRDIEKFLLGIESYQDVVARRAAEIASQVVVVGFKSGDDLPAKGFRSLMAFVMQDKMSAFSLREIGFDRLFALCLGQQLLHFGVGTQ